MKICFGTIEGLPIWFFGNEGIFFSQNSYWHTTSFSIDFFVFVRSDQKVALYWLVWVTMHKNCLNIIPKNILEQGIVFFYPPKYFGTRNCDFMLKWISFQDNIDFCTKCHHIFTTFCGGNILERGIVLFNVQSFKIF